MQFCLRHSFWFAWKTSFSPYRKPKTVSYLGVKRNKNLKYFWILINYLWRQIMKKTILFSLLVFILILIFDSCYNENQDGYNGDNFSVTFDLNGGNISGITASISIMVKINENIKYLPVPEKKDNDFCGWFIDDGTFLKAFTLSTQITSNIVVYANWITFSGDWVLLYDNIELEQKFIITFLDTEFEFILSDYYDSNIGLIKGTILINGLNAIFFFTAIWDEINTIWDYNVGKIEQSFGSLSFSIEFTGRSSGCLLKITDGDYKGLTFVKQ
jgi:hypothetical protein